MLEDLLHDEVDAIEDLRERAANAAKKIIAENIGDLLTRMETANDLLTAMALLLENELATLTTEAVREGARLADNRASKLGSQ